MQNLLTFSILERIDVGETSILYGRLSWGHTFSILERIDVGETKAAAVLWGEWKRRLSVSSNGSTWVKLIEDDVGFHCRACFQYPRTDRRG